MRFNVLCDELGLNSKPNDKEKLHIIEQWCYEQVSRDIRYTGELQDSYEKYLELAKSYLDEVLPSIPEDIGNEIAQYGGKNIIQAAAFLGLDRILSSLKLTDDLLNKPDLQGMTPLHFAAVKGNFYTVSVLLSLGADPEKVNKNAQLPIFSALAMSVLHEDDLPGKKIKIFRLLKDKAPQTLKHQDNSGDTVLHLMVINNFSTLMTEILATNTELAFIDNNHTHYSIHTAILNNRVDCVRILLQIKDVATLADSKKRLALHYAARYSEEEIVSLCCEATEDLNALDARGRTPFMLAAQAGNVAALKIFVEKGADIHLTDGQGYSALHYAVLAGHLETLRWLLENTTIDVNASDKKQQTLLSLCDTPEKEKIKNLLVERGAR